MPKVWEQGLIKIFINHEKNHKRPHLHVYIGNDKSASISFDGVVLAHSKMTSSDLKQVINIVTKNKKEFEEKWREFND